MLLVWDDPPYWVVVDREAGELLLSLDGTRTISEDARRQLAMVLDDTERLGILVDSAVAFPEPMPYPEPLLENISINITRQCNLRCTFCYLLPDLQRRSALGGEVEAEDVAGFIGRSAPIRQHGTSVTILGGEPLLARDKVVAIAKACHKLDLPCLVSTNGLLVDDDFADAARNASLEVQVSIDGARPETHDAIRGTGTFAKALAATRRLVSRGARTVLSMVCHAGNVGELEDFLELARCHGVKDARFIPLKRMGGGAAHGPVAWGQLLEAASDVFSRKPHLRSASCRDAISILAAACGRSCRRASCGTGCQTLLIDADGSVYPCLNTARPELRLGNLREPGFDPIAMWRSEQLDRYRRETAVDAVEGCAACEVRHWCLGGCRGECLELAGRLTHPPWNCEDLKRSIVEMFWLLSSDPSWNAGGDAACRG